MLACVFIPPSTCLRKHPLPRPHLTGIRIFFCEGRRKRCRTKTVFAVRLMNAADIFQMFLQRKFQGHRQHSFTVGYSEANRLPHVPPLICNASTGIRLRYPHHPRTSRSQRCFNHYGLHPRPQPWRSRRSKPYRPNVICFSLFSEDRPNLAVNDVFRRIIW